MPERLKKRGRPRKWTGPLAEWMIASGVRAEDLADEIGVDLSTAYRWFRGEQNPSLSTAQAIAEIARRSDTLIRGRKLTLEDILSPRGRSTRRGQSHDGVFSRPTAEVRNRRLATSQE